MKIHIELDLTPAEAKELFMPSDKQAELWSKLQSAYVESLMQAMQRNAVDTFSSMFSADKNGQGNSSTKK